MRFTPTVLSMLAISALLLAGCPKKNEGPKTTSVHQEPPARSVDELSPPDDGQRSPGGGDTATVEPETVYSPPVVEDEPQGEQEYRIYTVKKGDKGGFYSIAREQLGDERRWREIKELNPDVDPTKLRVGQKIKIPAK